MLAQGCCQKCVHVQKYKHAKPCIRLAPEPMKRFSNTCKTMQNKYRVCRLQFSSYEVIKPTQMAKLPSIMRNKCSKAAETLKWKTRTAEALRNIQKKKSFPNGQKEDDSALQLCRLLCPPASPAGFHKPKAPSHTESWKHFSHWNHLKSTDLLWISTKYAGKEWLLIQFNSA